MVHFTFEAGAVALFFVWAAKQFFSGQIRVSKNPLYLPTLLFFGLILAQIALRLVRLRLRYKVRSPSVRLLWDRTSNRSRMRQRGRHSKNIFHGGDPFRSPLRFFCARPGACLQRQDLLVLHATVSWLNLWELRQPRPLCGFDGDVSADSAWCLAWATYSKGDSVFWSPSSAILMAGTIFLSGSRGGMIAFVLEIVLFAALTLAQRRNPRVSTRLGHTVCLGSHFLGFSRQRASSGPTWGPGPGDPLGYYEGLLANVSPPAGVGGGA